MEKYKRNNEDTLKYQVISEGNSNDVSHCKEFSSTIATPEKVKIIKVNSEINLTAILTLR